jgi:hypothetical protein
MLSNAHTIEIERDLEYKNQQSYILRCRIGERYNSKKAGESNCSVQKATTKQNTTKGKQPYLESTQQDKSPITHNY